ncbi:MAG: hypothetical protein EP330_22735 [Deltaproteobacteria bacterium]|nr:MAG: hypothetical protein EP330_22735 [Deltaproteobacteria bacterium]
MSSGSEHEGGDPARHLSGAELALRFARAAEAPREEGRVVLLVERPEAGVRRTLERVRLAPDAPLGDDRWARGSRNPEAQITAMEAGVGEVIANGQDLALFGDNLVLDLALDAVNLPIGSRIQAGEAVLELTPKPHTGCKKYRARFGLDALRYISDKERRALRMRGVHFAVIEAGEVAVGDAVRVLRRGL